MADFQRYQPRHSRSGSRAGRRWLVVIIGIIILVVLVRACQGGPSSSNTNVTNETNTASGIELRNENTNATNSNESMNESESSNNANVNSSSATNTNTVVVAPDGSELDLTICKQAVSQVGTRKVMALTFSVGAANADAEKLLDVLAKDKIAASFFVAGTFAEKNPDYVRLVAAKGFGVYNRSYDNPKFSTLTAEEVQAQLEKAETAISGVTDRTTKPFFRPPFGDQSDGSVSAAYASGYCTMLWTVDALDWQTGVTAEQARQRVVAKARPGGIVMLSAGYDITPDATRLIAADLRKAGYTLVSLVELLGS